MSSVEALLRAAGEACEGQLRSWVREFDGLPAEVAAYQFGWAGAGEGGKAVRAALTLACARAVGGEATSAVPAAAAVEMVHNLSLLYDDVLDGDPVRRHRDAAWRVFGPSAAARAADALLLTSFDVLTGRDGTPGPVAREASAALLETLVALAVGEGLDLVFERRDAVSLEECLEMVEAKTASLFACACRLGALYGGAGSEAAAGWAAFGQDLGTAFQMIDDLLGIWGDPAVTGKPVFADLARRKLSVPVVAALTSGTPEGAELAREYRRPQARPEELARLVELAGGRRWTTDRAAAHAAAARTRLAGLTDDPDAAAELALLVALVVDREH